MATETVKYVSIHGDLVTPSGKVNFPEVFEPKVRQGGKTPKYSLMLVYEKDDIMQTDEFKEMIRRLDEMAKKMFKVAGYRSTFKGKPLNSPFKTSEHYDFLDEGQVGIRFNTKFKPEVLDPDGKTYLETDKDFYSGCIASLSNFWLEDFRKIDLAAWCH